MDSVAGGISSPSIWFLMSLIWYQILNCPVARMGGYGFQPPTGQFTRLPDTNLVQSALLGLSR